MPKDVAVTTDGPTRAKFRVFIKGSVESVWDEITRTDKPIPAFFGAKLEAPSLTPGSTMAMRTQSGKYTGVVGEIIAFDPPRIFAHTFKFTNLDDPPCIVRYELEPTDQDGGGTIFTMTLSELTEGTKSAKQMMSGGTLICNTLKAVIETGKPKFGGRMLLMMIRMMEPLTPKRCASEHWPVKAAGAPRQGDAS